MLLFKPRIEFRDFCHNLATIFLLFGRGKFTALVMKFVLLCTA